MSANRPDTKMTLGKVFIRVAAGIVAVFIGASLKPGGSPVKRQAETVGPTVNLPSDAGPLGPKTTPIATSTPRAFFIQVDGEDSTSARQVVAKYEARIRQTCEASIRKQLPNPDSYEVEEVAYWQTSGAAVRVTVYFYFLNKSGYRTPDSTDCLYDTEGNLTQPAFAFSGPNQLWN